MKATWIVARRELKALFDQPTGYILLVVFIFINDFLFFRQAYLFRVASLRPMLEMLPWIFLFFIPAITMRAFAEDVRSGTIEVVLAQPISELQLLLGKYLGQVLFVSIALALTLPIPMALSFGADLYVGVIFAQYTGTVLLVCAFTAIGIWTSNLTQYQMSAFILAVAVMFVMVLVGLDPVLVGLPPVLNAVAARLGVLSHFRDIARGVIDLRDAVYFVTVTGVFLMLAYTAMMARKLSHKGQGLQRLRTATAMVVVGLIVVNLFGRHIRGRLDLTPGNAYTLSRATKDVVGDLDDIVTIKLFVTDELPPEVTLIQRDLDDLLRDYRSAGRGMIRFVTQDPSDEGVLEEAQSLGIPPVQFNVIGESELTVREGYLGIAVQHADETETIGFVQRTDDLEYRLTAFIRSMTRQEQSVVGIYTAPQPPQQQTTFGAFRQGLEQGYEVRTLSLPGEGQPTDDIDVIVLIGSPDSLPADQMDRLRGFLDSGGSALILADGMTIQAQPQFAVPMDVVWNDLLEPYGLSIRSDMVYDLISNEQVQMPTQFGRMIAAYPLWVRSTSTRAAALNAEIETVFMPWPSSLDTSGARAGTVTPLFVTTEAGGADSMMAMLAPRRQFAQDDLHVRLLAASVNPLVADTVLGPRGRVVVVGNVDMLQDRYAQNVASNLAFALNSVDWLAQDEGMASIRAKNRTPPQLAFSSPARQEVAKNFNVAGIPLILIVIAITHTIRRNRRSRQRYDLAPAPDPAPVEVTT